MDEDSREDIMMNIVDLQKALLLLCPSGEITWDNNNQIIFITDLTDDEDGTLREIAERI
jgi:hypothetical protein